MMLYRWDVINTLIKKYGYKNYLEIGLAHGDCYDKISCTKKANVDPMDDPNQRVPMYKMTSDEFFENEAPSLEKWDIIFIDGLHRDFQVDKDIENSLKFLNKNGSIVLHDCSPAEERHQLISEKGGRVSAAITGTKEWNGDVWKSIVKFRSTNKDFGCMVINSDYGLGWINESIEIAEPFEYELTYKALESNRQEYLGLVPPEYFMNLIN